MKHRIRSIKSCGLLLAGMALGACPAHAHAGQGGDIALRDGERMIAQCLDYAASRKYPPLSVGVIDAGGTLVAFKRQDGAAPATADAALLKARTSLRLNAPTAALGPAVANDAATRDAFLLMQLTTLPGGEPVASGSGQAAGAVGVSGGDAGQDAACARQAVGAEPGGKK
jgi:glc operon protein GlcG